jgi:4-amino-4-deoxy-L-arabinose transferase-like glycosyltransferase
MRKNIVILIAIVPVFLFALLGAFARIMLMFDHNEHMYLAAALLSRQGNAQYRDFAYLQMPYLPLIYRAVYTVFQVHSSYLLVGKIASFMFTALSALAIFFIAWRTLRDLVSGLASATLFLMNITILGPAAEVSNYIAPVAFSLVSCALFLWALDRERPRTFGCVLAGIMLALAIGTKLTYATAALPFFAVALFSTRVRRIFLPFALGLALGLLPIVLYLADFDRFLFNNLTYHAINTQWRLQTGHNEPMTLAAKLPDVRDLFLRFDTLLVLAASALGALLAIARAARCGRAPRWRVQCWRWRWCW